MNLLRSVSFVMLAVLIMACPGERARQQLPDTPAAETLVVRTPPADTGCPLVLPWRPCSVLDRLERAGLAPQERGVVRQPFFSVEGTAFTLADDELQTFIFADSAQAARETMALDSARVAPPTTMITWRRRPTLIRSANLVAILLSDDDQRIERVSLAIGGGLPASP